MQVKTVRCTHVVAQVSLGFFDADDNLVGEETFPQSNGNVLTAKLFHPHNEQLERLIEMCVQQAWAKLTAQIEVSPGGPPAVASLPTDGNSE